MSEDKIMRGNEFIKKIQKLAKKRAFPPELTQNGEKEVMLLYILETV